MNKRIKQLYRIIDEAYAEIEDIRKKCNHENYYVTVFTYKIDRLDPQRVCRDCEEVIKGITKEEIDEALKEHDLNLVNFHVAGDADRDYLWPDNKKKNKKGQGGNVQ